MRSLSDYATSPHFDNIERMALELTDAMIEAPARVTDELFVRLREHFSEPQIVELASAIAWENYRARFNRVFDIASEDFSEGAFCPIVTSGQR